MKKRVVKGLAAVCCGAVLLSSAVYSSVQATVIGANATAGISSAVTLHAATTAAQLSSVSAEDVSNALCFNQTAGVVNDLVVRLGTASPSRNTETADTVGTGTKEEEDAAEEAPPETAEEPEDFGFENLGICNVDSGYVNVRKEASTSTEVVGKMTKNAGCEILGEENGFYRIESGDVEGYVSSDYILTGDEAYEVAGEVATKAVVIDCDGLRVREEQNTDSKVLEVEYRGSELELVEDLGEWIEVKYGDETGYVYAEYTKIRNVLDKAETIPKVPEVSYVNGVPVVSGAAGAPGAVAVASVPTEVSGVRTSLVQNALQYVGNPYVWGGTSLTNGADCSGFVLAIYSQYGIYLPHSSSGQSMYGTRINASQARPGDLFFYSNGGGIGHVGIYIGNGQIVHAATESVGITVSNAFYTTPAAVTSLLG